MNITEYFNIIKNKINKANRRAVNPFLSKELSSNPFESAFYKTYVWIENKNRNADKSE